jgi:hypothetical protein
MGTNRKARRKQNVKKAGKSRPQQFYDAMEDADALKKGQQEALKSAGGDHEAKESDALLDEREARKMEALDRMEERPELSTMFVDEETGIELIQQGKAVMDVVTRKAVKLSDLGPDYRLAQMFPGVPPDVRQKYRFDYRTIEVPEMVEQLKEACSVTLDDGTKGIPPHPSVANKALDFVLANRDYLGYRMKRTLGRLQMRSMWKKELDQAREYQALWKNFETIENHLSAPFRQMILDGEGRIGPNFGNLDLKSYANGELYERTANYLVLKGMVAHWEKKVKDAEYAERTPQTKDNFVQVLATGDPKRYLPDPPILFTLRECAQVCGMAQKMTKAFVDTPELFDDLPPEVRFVEAALTVQGGTALRKFMVDEFCPAEGITPEALREGLRRLYQQFVNMQIDPYGDLTNILDKLCQAMAVGTDDERNPYDLYLSNPDPNGPGYFQSYTFNHERLSLVRFLDSQYPSADRGGSGGGPAKLESPSLGNLFGFGGDIAGSKKDDHPDPDAPPPKETEYYKVPVERANGRPHELGWLDSLKDDDKERVLLGKVKPGKIIME